MTARFVRAVLTLSLASASAAVCLVAAGCSSGSAAPGGDAGRQGLGSLPSSSSSSSSSGGGSSSGASSGTGSGGSSGGSSSSSGSGSSGSGSSGSSSGGLCAGTVYGLPAGSVCGSADAGVPACGGACVTRACSSGPTGGSTLTCQPSSGCRVLGESCTSDGDCCGSAGMPGAPSTPVTCVANGSSCKVCTQNGVCLGNGEVCKLATMSCNASCDCCAGNCEQTDTCRQDDQGVPRCTNVTCTSPGGACSSSADCCNAAPCVPGTKGLVCYSATCVPLGGPCTTPADCCSGETCTSATCVAAQ